jgi:hypothetical protein
MEALLSNRRKAQPLSREARVPLLAVAAATLVAGPAWARALTSWDIAAYAERPYDKARRQNTREVLGTHHGVRVIAEYPCSDVCPDYTTRIIHYAVGPGRSCALIGGRAQTRLVPRGIAVSRQSFCVPKILIDRRLQIGEQG